MLGWFCFEGRYIHTLLTKAYKFDKNSWDNIHFVQKVHVWYYVTRPVVVGFTVLLLDFDLRCVKRSTST